MKTILRAQLTVPVTAMLAIVMSISCTPMVFSQANLVKDINRGESPFFIEYSQLTPAEGHFFFVSRGKELWRSDGTTSGTRRLKTIRGIENLTLIGNILYFSGTDVSGAELWKSDGTTQGTVRIKDIRRGLNSSTPRSFMDLNGIVYFVADNGTGFELWKTNGTATGTTLVKDIWPGPSGSEPSSLTAINNTLYFGAADELHGRELWKSDGTAAGTLMVRDIYAAQGRSSDPQEIIKLGSLLFFSAYDTLGGRELWRSDGTGNSTIRVKDINPGPTSSSITSIRKIGNAIYFDANNGTRGTSLWRSTGTEAGTSMLKDISSDNANYGIEDMTVVSNRLYWLLVVRDTYQVWVSDGTAAGTQYVTTFDKRITAAQFTLMNNRVFYFSGFFDHEISSFVAQLTSINPDGTDWREVWSMSMPFNFDDNLQYDFSIELTALRNALFFPGVVNDQDGYKLLKSSGTTATPTVLINTYKPTLSSNPTEFWKNNRGTFFVTRNNAWEEPHLWRTDGTNAGTIHLKTLPWLGNLASTDNTLFFFGSENGESWHLWSSDGTVSGTIPLKEVPQPSGLQRTLNIGNRVFFHTDEKVLWVSNGTSAGTMPLKTFSSIEYLAPSHNGVYVLARSANGGQELWKSNGTAAGTTRVKVIRATNGPMTGATSALLQNIFYFLADDGIHGPGLWRSNGTSAGTFMITDTNLGAIRRIAAFDDAIYINAQDTDGELSLFVSNGTGAGTKKIYDSDQIVEFFPYNNRLLFISAASYGHRLSSTDGTTAGTRFLGQLTQGYWPIVSFVELNDIAYFSFQQFDGPFGADTLWRTDGTACGTFGIDIGLKEVANTTTIGDNLLLTGFHRDFGNELFTYDPSGASSPPCHDSFDESPNALATLKRTGEIENATYAPNPFDREFSVVINSEHQYVAEVSVFDLAGGPVMFATLETNKTHKLGGDWLEGLYLMRIVVDGKVLFKRLIKRRP